MTRSTTLLAVLATLALAVSADAQVSISLGGGGRGVSIGGGQPIGMPAPPWTYRNNRRFITQPTVTHVNPWSGTVHTRNTEVFESAGDFGRNESRNNGTMRRVNRPIYDRFGNLKGYEQGVEWRNSLTGQRHHETVKTTVNGNPWGGRHINHSRSFGSPVVNETISVGAAAPTP